MQKFLRTLMLAVLMLPFASQAQNTQTFNFEDQVIPAEWTNDATYPWTVVSPNNGQSGTYCIKSGNGGVNSSTSTITATFTFVGDGTFTFKGGCWGEGTSTAWDKCIFEIDGVQQFANGALAAWNTYTYAVTAGTHTFTWKYSKDSSVNPTGDAFFVDDVVVDLGEIPDCWPVSSLMVVASETTTESITLEWADNNNTGATYSVYQISGTDTTEVDNVVVANNTAVITELSPATLYTFGVKADCGSLGMSNLNTINVRTACGAINQFPWEEDFESYASGLTDIPCWSNYRIVDGTGSGTLSSFKIYVGSNGSNSTHQLQLADMPAGTMTKLLLPEMNLPEGDNYMFTLDVYRNTNSKPTEGIRVFVSADTNLDNATELAFISRDYTVSDNNLIPAEASSAWYNYELPLGMNGTVYIIIRGESQWGSSTYMDNFKVKRMPNCPKPTNLAASQIFGRTATLAWSSDADNWQVEYKKSTETVWNEQPATDSTIVLTDLAPTTTYNARVKAICSDDESDYSREISFTTKAACQKPTNITVSDLTAFGATVNWVDTLANGWQFQYITMGTPNDTSDVIELTETTYTFEDLSPSTTYKVRVLADCGDMDSLSAWTSWVSFTTPLACEIPTGLVANIVPGSGNMAIVTWTDTVATAWQIALIHGTDTSYIDVTDTTGYTFDTLTAEETYKVMVRANCEEDYMGYSPWSPAKTFVPTNSYLITVADGTNTNSNVPVYGLWADDYLRCQTIYPATMLAPLAGGDITGLTYYISSPASNAWTGTFTVKMMEVTDATLSAFNAEIVNEPELYTGTLNGTGATMTITLSQPYTYAGGNLLIEVNETVSDNFSSASFYGVSANGASWQGYSSSSWASITGSVQNFIPKTTFSFEPGVITDCARPDSLTVSDVDAHTATFDWQGDASEYLLQYKQADATNWTEVSNVSAPYTLTGLQQNTTYTARVKAICGSDTSMASFGVSFTTTISCPAPTNIQAILTPGDGTVARVTWTDTVGTAWQVCLVLDGDTSDIYDVTDTTAYDFTELTPEAIYTAMVRSICDEASDDISEWVHGTFNPTAKVVVGTPQTTNYYLPTESNYNYSLTQQIYTAAELGNTPGAIMSVDFMNGGTEKTRTIDVYMVSTTASTISSFVPVTASDLVFSGTVTFTPNTWTSLVFDSPFIYDGTSNVILVVDDNNGSYSYGLACYTFSAPNQAIYVYSDGTNYDPTAPSSYSGTPSSEKNYVRFLLGEPPTCLPVTNLMIDDSLTTASSITLTWNDTNAVNNYNIYIINGDNDSLVGNTTEMTYTITELEATTGYTFGVTANCGDGESTMRTVSGRTDCLGGSCNIQLVLHDSYGDGWNGNAIDVIQAGESLGSYTISSGSSATYNVSVCSGAPVSFSWTEGSYAYETSFEIKDGGGLTAYTCTDGSNISGTFTTINDPCPSCLPVADFEVSEIGNHSAMLSWTEQGEATSWQIMIDGDTTNAITVNETEYELTGLSSDSSYTVTVRAICDEEDMSAWVNDITFNTLVACPTPTDLTADVMPTSADVTWNGFGNTYQLEYALIPENTDTNASNESIWLQYDNGTNSNNIGNSNGGTFTWGVMYPAAMLAGNSNLTKVAVYENSSYLTSPYTVNVYTGGTTAPGTLVATENVTPTGTNGIHEVNLSTIANINPNDNLWVTVTATGTYIIAACEVTPVDPNSQWIEDGGTWANIGDLSSSLANYSWMVRAYVEPGFDEDQMTWTVVNNATSPYTINNLTPETRYVVRVKANCGSDGESDYAYATFTTDVTCPAVTLAVDSATENSITISWESIANNFSVYNGSNYVANTTANTYTFTGLDASTAYNFSVVALCSATDSSHAATINASTLCGTITVLPFIEEFAGSDLGCWTSEGDGNWTVGTGDYSTATGAYSGNTNARITHTSNGDVTTLISPVFNFNTTEDSIQVSFAHVQRAWSNDIDEHRVLYRLSDTSAWIEVADYTTAIASWTVDSVIIPSDVYQIAFEYTDNYGYGVGIDKVIFSVPGVAPVVDSFTVTLNTTAGGTVSPMGSTIVAEGASFTATATADSGYHFVNWTNAAGAVINATNPYTFTVTANVTLTAHFEANGSQTNYYTVTVSSADTTMGTVSSTANGQVAENTSVTATATAKAGYHFVNWTNAAGAVINATNPYTFTVTSDVTLVANFEANGTTYVEATIDASEIQYWVGNGNNQAIVAVNWANAAYAWGVKFSEASITVQGALDIIKDNDPRFNYTLGDYGLANITFDEGQTHLSGNSDWNQLLNNEYGSGLAQNVVNNDFVKWGEDAAGIPIDSTYYQDWGWYYTYVFTMPIVPMWSYVGIQSIDMSNVYIYSVNSTIYVKGAEGQNIYIYDLNGRTIATKLNASETMAIPMAENGVYLVRVGNASAKRVIVMR